MPKLFISYSRDNKECVEEMVNDLQSVDHTAWIDNELIGGQSWWDKILHEIQACDYFIIALSSAFLKSEACRSEAGYANTLDKTIIPVKIAGDFDENLLPPELSKLQITDFDAGSKKGALGLIHAIDNAVQSPSLLDPLPQAPAIPVSYLAELLQTINSTEALDYDQQAALLFKLRNHYHTTGESMGVLQALLQLDSRRDLLSDIGKALTKLKSEIEHQEKSLTKDTAESESKAEKPEPVFRKYNSVSEVKTDLKDVVGTAKSDRTAYGLSIVSFLIPLVGLVLFFVWRVEQPKRAKLIAWAAAIGVFFYTMLSGDLETDPYYY